MTAYVGKLEQAQGKIGWKRANLTVTGPASYTTGGFTFSCSPYLETVKEALSFSAGGYIFEPVVASFTAATAKFLVYYGSYVTATNTGSALIEVAAATNLSAVSGNTDFIGE
tara:strand:+ start:15763 stop:16098 length:336 start_codon:yes stop_codon:yes gene_type:complete